VGLVRGGGGGGAAGESASAKAAAAELAAAVADGGAGGGGDGDDEGNDTGSVATVSGVDEETLLARTRDTSHSMSIKVGTLGEGHVFGLRASRAARSGHD
jgi:hypothetical protein